MINSAYLPPIYIAAAFALDALLGDPLWLPHPVRWIGAVIAAMEGVFRGISRSRAGEKILGALLAVVVVAPVYFAAHFALELTQAYSRFLYIAAYVYIVWMCLSIKSLKTEAQKISEAISRADLAGARSRLSMIVGRDTHSLDERGVLRAVIETVSENTSDGVVAPLFFLAIGGPPLMIAYKAINTLDSMVGYKNSRYINFGWFSARLDDAANLAPARLTALLMVAASFMTGLDGKGAFRIWRRDNRNHPSPNSAHSESAAAGALGVRLGGTSIYEGVASEKPYIGDDIRPITVDTVKKCVLLMRVTALLAMLLVIAAYSMIFLYEKVFCCVV